MYKKLLSHVSSLAASNNSLAYYCLMTISYIGSLSAKNDPANNFIQVMFYYKLLCSFTEDISRFNAVSLPECYSDFVFPI